MASKLALLAALALASSSSSTSLASASSSSAATSSPLARDRGRGDDGPLDPPPRISLRRLRSSSGGTDAGGGDSLHRLLLDSRGVLRVAAADDDDVGREGTGPGAALAAIRSRALGALCDCPAFADARSFDDVASSHPRDVREIDLPDGTVRRTLASASVGFDVEEDGGAEGGGGGDAAAAAATATTLELPPWLDEACGAGARESFEDLRDAVADVARSFVEALDREKGEGGRGYGEILSEANHLEHFHVYEKSSGAIERSRRGRDARDIGRGRDLGKGDVPARPEEEEEAPTLDYHTDAGFFLAFVPAMNCRTRATDADSFRLKGRDGPAPFGDDEVILMLGAGAQHWLSSFEGDGGARARRQPLPAASHALRLADGARRAWYGKMHLLPSSPASGFAAAATSRSSAGPSGGRGDARSFEEVMTSFELRDYDAHAPSSPVDGCGIVAFDEDRRSAPSTGAEDSPARRRRRLQHVNSPSNCNNVTTFFCWYQCISIPRAEDAESLVGDGYSLYCLDPARLSEGSSVEDAAAPCKGGFTHNSKCLGSWQETEEGAPAYPLPYEVKEKGHGLFSQMSDMGDQYCYGGTSMYMDGFTWQGTTCVIYLFRSWVLTSPGKFALAALGSILFGIALEFVLWKRRSIYTMAPGPSRLCLSALVYGLQLTMGYFIMLVIMTYSGPLFVSTVGGMMLGHVIFNAQDSLTKRWAEGKKKPESEEVAAACCGSNLQGSVSNTELMRSYQNGDSVAGLEENGGSGGLKSPPEEKRPPVLDESSALRNNVADGATPCCQYTV